MPLSIRQLAIQSYERRHGRELPAGRHNRELDRRMQNLKATTERLRPYFERQRKAEIDARMRKLLAGPVRPVDPFGQQIEEQIKTQPAEYRPQLRKLYHTGQVFNILYFGGRLRIPMLKVAEMKNAWADCRAHQNEQSVIRFSTRCLTTRSAEEQADTLLHEQIHQLIGERDGFMKSAIDPHGKEFTRIANNIAQQRGWPDCSEHIHSGDHAAKYWPPRTP